MRLLLRSAGSNELITSSDGPGVVNEDAVSRSSKTCAVLDVLEAFRWPFRQACHRSDLDTLEDVETIRNGRLFVAMLFDGDCEDGDELITSRS